MDTYCFRFLSTAIVMVSSKRSGMACLREWLACAHVIFSALALTIVGYHMSVIFYSLIIYYSITYLSKVECIDDRHSGLCAGLKRILAGTFSFVTRHL